MKGRVVVLLALVAVIGYSIYTANAPLSARTPALLAQAAGPGSVGASDTANKLCPQPNQATEGYDKTKPKFPAKYMDGTQTKTNLFGKLCSEMNEQERIYVYSHCEGPGQCHADQYEGEDGKMHDVQAPSQPSLCKTLLSCIKERIFGISGAKAESRIPGAVVATPEYQAYLAAHGGVPPSSLAAFNQWSQQNTPPTVSPVSPANTQLDFGGSKLSAADANAIITGSPPLSSQSVAKTGTVQPSPPSAGSILQQVAPTGLAQRTEDLARPSAAQVAQTGNPAPSGPAFVSGGAQLPFGGGPLPPPPAAGGTPAPTVPAISPTSVAAPALPRSQNTFGTLGSPSAPRGSDGGFSFPSFISSFSPVVFVERAANFVQTIMSPPVNRIIVAIPSITVPTLSRNPISASPPPAIPVPTVSEIVAAVRLQQNSVSAEPPPGLGRAAAPLSGANPTELSDAQILSTYLTLKSAARAVVTLTPPAPPTPSAPGAALPSASLLDASFANPKALISSGDISDKSIILFSQSSFEQQGVPAPTTSESSIESAHPISIVDLWSAIMSGSFTRIRQILGAGRPSDTGIPSSNETGSEAPPSSAPSPAPVGEHQSPTSTEVAANVSQATEVRPHTAVQPPPLSTTLWSPNFQTHPVSAGVSFTTNPTPLPSLGNSRATEDMSSTTSTAPGAGALTRLVNKAGDILGRAFAWVSGLWSTGPGSMSAARAGNAAVRLLADPPKAVKGARTTLYWTSNGVDDCTIFAPDDSAIGRGAEGTTLTPVLESPAVFTARCSAGSSIVVTAVTVGIQ